MIQFNPFNAFIAFACQVIPAAFPVQIGNDLGGGFGIGYPELGASLEGRHNVLKDAIELGFAYSKTRAKSIFRLFKSGVMFLAKESLLNCFSMEEGKP
jgi:hypothetical protein